jgi:hypothetical protein
MASVTTNTSVVPDGAIDTIDTTEATNEKTPWIKITVGGMTAGVAVAAFTYSAAEHSSYAVATAAGTGINIAGKLVSLGTDYIAGSAAGTTIRIVSSAAAETTKQSMISSGRIGSAVIAATAGAVTALTITIGSRIIEYTIEYGGQLTREAAVRLSEMYLKYKSVQSGFVESGNICDLNFDQWVIVGDPKLTDDVCDGSRSDSGDNLSEFSSSLTDPKVSGTNETEEN